MFSFFRKKSDAGSPWETQRMPDVVPTVESPAAAPEQVGAHSPVSVSVPLRAPTLAPGSSPLVAPTPATVSAPV
ncbi:MAG: hypothetical protein M3N82_15980, partial [Pseudomonadota bacterium]|nr:hypothetical protein [Pseudomonadota bacterium]